jgi:hypothetical protein
VVGSNELQEKFPHDISPVACRGDLQKSVLQVNMYAATCLKTSRVKRHAVDVLD